MPSIKNLFGLRSQPPQWEDTAMQADFDYNTAQAKWQEDSTNYYYKVALPGLSDSNIHIKVDDSHGDPASLIVTITASAHVQNPTLPYKATFPVPTSRVKVDEIQASIDNGVLAMKFPKQNAFHAQGGRDIPLKSRL